MNNRFWIVGVYENYAVAGLGSDFELTPGVRYGTTKSYLATESYNHTGKIEESLTVLDDPVYHRPTAGAFDEYTLTMASAYLHYQLCHELCISQDSDVLVLHSLLDIYAEYLMCFPHRVKWIDDVIRNASWQVSKIYYLSLRSQIGYHIADEREEKYHSILKRLMHDMKIKFVMPYSYKDVPRFINEYRLVIRGRDTGVGIVTSDPEIHGEQTDSSGGNPETTS